MAARNQGTLSAQLEVLMGQLRLNPATVKALQALDFSPKGWASAAALITVPQAWTPLSSCQLRSLAPRLRCSLAGILQCMHDAQGTSLPKLCEPAL